MISFPRSWVLIHTGATQVVHDRFIIIIIIIKRRICAYVVVW